MTPTRDPVFAIAVMLGWFMWILFAGLAHAHDPNRPDLGEWFNGLRSKLTAGSFCCSRSDAKPLDDSDWDTKNAHYRVRLNGNWYDVPDDAVVEEPNKVGHALVWTTNGYHSGTGYVVMIKCFLPGTWS